MSLSSISGLALATLLTQLHNHDEVQDFGGYIYMGFQCFMYIHVPCLYPLLDVWCDRFVMYPAMRQFCWRAGISSPQSLV